MKQALLKKLAVNFFLMIFVYLFGCIIAGNLCLDFFKKEHDYCWFYVNDKKTPTI